MSDEILGQILRLCRLYYDSRHRARPDRKFAPGIDRIHYARRNFDHTELESLVSAALEFWLTGGKHEQKFESQLSKFFGSKAALFCNSGSSANLLAISTLCSEELPSMGIKRRPLSQGDEVITPAVTFPTTLAPVIQNGLVPVFVDCKLETLNIDESKIRGAISPKTRAIFAPHTLGTPCRMDAISEIAKEHDLWLIEDCCDALGASYGGKLCGTFGDLATLSFYPAHHITTGEGGAVIINNPKLLKTARSIRDWGRDCWCLPGISNTCGKRFGWRLGDLPAGYDHKYIYSNVGYNLKGTDLQAAIGAVQITKAGAFIKQRRENYNKLYHGLKGLSDKILFLARDERAEPSPFGFPMTLLHGVDRTRFIRHLEENQIETRLVFGGNILRQPAFKNIRARVSGSLTNSDTVMKQTLFIGVHPGLTAEMIDYMVESVKSFFH